VTRRYPVDFSQVRERLAEDLKANYDYAIHLGQAPRSAQIRLETIALNVRGDLGQLEISRPLLDDGPVAYRSSLPLHDWSIKLEQAGIPSAVSYHAGTYVCNGTFYLSNFFVERMALRTRSTFMHLPLDVTQTIGQPEEFPSLASATAAQALAIILNELVQLPEL
jgi:pyroglutamyl-peptidase